MRNSLRLLLAAMFALSLMAGIGCSDFDGEQDGNQPPSVSFVNVHDNSEEVVYDFAPVIYWRGDDPDGFVEYYSYADVTTSAAIEDPIDYISRIPDEAWVDTIATQATIKLLSEADEITEHVFYLRCQDNEGQQSDVIYARFNRTNSAPNIPRIGLSGTDEGLFANRYVVSDTLFSAPQITNVYPGIQFSWRGSDPDDKALFTIPLEYQAVLIKSPNDTIFVNPWTDEVEIQLVDLETGFYTLNVWARDDGLTRSVAPARAEFNVIRPTFENDLLVVLESPQYNEAQGTNPPDTASVRQYYTDLLNEVKDDVVFTDLDLDDGTDVRFLRITSQDDRIARALIAQYRLVIFSADHMLVANWTGSNYVSNKVAVLEDYLRVGGRVWNMGRCTAFGSMYYDLANNLDGAVLLKDFFGVDSLATPPNDVASPVSPYIAPPGDGNPVLRMRADMTRTANGIPTFPVLHWDNTKILENGFNIPGTDPVEASYYQEDMGMSGVDRIARDQNATTTQYFWSGSFGTARDVVAEDASVLPTGSNAFDRNFEGIYFPPTSTNAYIVLGNNNVTSVSRVYNADLDVEAEVVVVNDDLVLISYDEGQQWDNDHVLEVDYVYNPISIMHLKPVEVRLEGQQGGNTVNPFPALRFRTAMTTFSYYFIPMDEAAEAWALMLNWFYNPNVNEANFDFQ